MEITLLILGIVNLVLLIAAGMLLVRIRDALVREEGEAIANVDEAIARYLRDNPDARIGKIREFIRQCVEAEPEQITEILITYYRMRVTS